MDKGKKLGLALINVVTKQIKNNNPKETKETFNRLKIEFGKMESKRMIASCLSVEFYHVLKFKQPFNLERYIRNLNNLPNEAEE